MRLESAIDVYLSHLSVERALSPNTLSAYGADLGRFVGFCEGRKVRTARAVDAALVSGYLSALSRDGLGPRSTARHLSALRGLMRFLVREGELTSDPTAFAARPKTGRRLPRPITPEAMRELIDAPDEKTARGRRDRAMLSVAYSAGLRVSELVALKVGDVDFRRGVVAAFGK